MIKYLNVIPGILISASAVAMSQNLDQNAANDNLINEKSSGIKVTAMQKLSAGIFLP
jgi:hypothetical protein